MAKVAEHELLGPRANPVKAIWTYQDINAAAADVWELFVDTEHWPAWGPSVRRAELDGEKLEQGATGTVTTVLGAQLRFEITEYDEGAHWAWRVAGVPATEHSVEQLADGECRAGFGVPWIAAPYLGVCQIALRRIKTIAEKSEAST